MAPPRVCAVLTTILVLSLAACQEPDLPVATTPRATLERVSPTPRQALGVATPAVAAVGTPIEGPRLIASPVPLLAATPDAISTSVVAAVAPGLTLKIVSSLPRQGSNKGQTDSIVRSITMALEEVNYQVGGAAIEYLDLDDSTAERGAWDPAKEVENAVRAAGDPEVMVYIGPYNSDAAKLSIPILCQAGLLMMSPSTTYAGLTKPGKGEAGEPERYYPNSCKRNFLRVVATDDIQGAGAAWWSEGLGASSAYILDDGTTYGRAIAGLYAQAADPRSLRIVGGPESLNESNDYRPIAEKVRASRADVVFYGGTTQKTTGKLWQDLRSVLGPNVKLMGPDGIFKQAFVDAAGSAAEGSYVTFPGVPPSKLRNRGAEWYQRYKARFGSEPESYASYGYEIAQVALQAIDRAGARDRAKVRDAAFATREYRGVLGTWSFDENGDTTLRDMTGLRVTGGTFDQARAEPFPAPLETAGKWKGPLEQLDLMWNRDWEQVIHVLDGFRQEYPSYSPAKNKLFAALVTYGQQSAQSGQCEVAVRLLARAEELNRLENLQRGEAAAALRRGC